MLHYVKKGCGYLMLASLAPILPSSQKARQRLTLFLVLLVVVVGGFLLEYPQTVRCQAVLLPQRRWTLTEENPGVLLSRSTNLISGQTSHYQLFQFDRPAFLELEFPWLDAEHCAEGDVVLRARSSALVLEEARHARELSQARAHLEALKAGAKPASIIEGQLAVKRAETDLETFEILYERQKALQQQDIISDADLDELEARRKLLIMDVALAKAELEVRETGADPAEIAEAEDLIATRQTELTIVREMLESLTICSPVAGRISYGSGNDNTLFEVTPADSIAVKLFVPLDKTGSLDENTEFILRLVPEKGAPANKGTVAKIDWKVRVSQEGAFLTVFGVCANPHGQLASGMRGVAYLDHGKIRIWEFLFRSVKQTVQREFPTLSLG
jgi:hypothetical protein